MSHVIAAAHAAVTVDSPSQAMAVEPPTPASQPYPAAPKRSLEGNDSACSTDELSASKKARLEPTAVPVPSEALAASLPSPDRKPQSAAPVRLPA